MSEESLPPRLQPQPPPQPGASVGGFPPGFGKPTEEEQQRAIYVRIYTSLIPGMFQHLASQNIVGYGDCPFADDIAKEAEQVAVAACKRLGITVQFQRDKPQDNTGAT